MEDKKPKAEKKSAEKPGKWFNFPEYPGVKVKAMNAEEALEKLEAELGKNMKKDEKKDDKKLKPAN